MRDWGKWFKAAGVRAIKTVAQTAVATIGTSAAMGDVNWAGFYLFRNVRLVLGPFQGKPACIRIPWGRGVCGTAAETGHTQRVENVHDFPGHIACDCASNSEIVVPIFHCGEVAAVLDLDSPLFSRFSPGDQQGLEAFVHILEAEWGNMT